jgi:murein DD-endopeptidase MepM/ murein hydrolase activator NlpD
LICSLFLLALGALYAAGADEFRLDARQEGDSYVFTGENVHPCMPYHAVISFKELKNFSASVELPARVVVLPGAKRDLFRIDRIDKYKPAGYKVSTIFGPGDPGAKPDAACLYLMPFAHGTKHLVGQGYFGKFTHANARALDFNMDTGTQVTAARDGVVFRTKDDSDSGGPGPEYNRMANFVSVLHADGTWGEYAHFQFHGVRVKPCERVKAGQVIGLAGATGRTNGPHLHFAVFRAEWSGDETIPTLFLGENGKGVSIEEGKWYYAYHPDGPAFEAKLGETLNEADLEKSRTRVPVTGKVEFRTESVDNKTLLYCRNGTAKDQAVTIRLKKVKNLIASKRLPRTVQVPAGTEVYVLTLTQKVGSGQASYELEYSSKAVRR